MKFLTAVERMKKSQEKRVIQHQITALQGKVMEVTHNLQPVNDEACKVFEEIDGKGLQLDQVLATIEQRMEGHVIEKMIQEIVEQEARVKHQVEESCIKIEAFEVALTRSK
jgi:hypothetical protein